MSSSPVGLQRSSSLRAKKRVKTSAAIDIKANLDRQTEIVAALSKVNRENANQRMLKAIQMLDAELDDLQKRIPELQERLSTEEEDARSNNSVSPSQLHAENLEKAREHYNHVQRLNINPYSEELEAFLVESINQSAETSNA